MARQALSSLPFDLEAVRQRFEEWRKTRTGRSRIPESLWSRAIAASKAHGVYLVSKALRLDYLRLKHRVSAARNPSQGSLSPFVEVGLSRTFPSAEWTIELQEKDGARMTVHLKGSGSLDLADLSRSFFGRNP